MFIITLTILATFIANSFFEWAIHGLLMHKEWGTSYLRTGHHEHHGDYPLTNYKNNYHGEHVHLPLWGAVITVGFMTIIGLSISYMITRWEVAWTAATVSLFYFWAYNYVHTAFHVPNDRWFEKTRIYKFLDRHHRIHHAIEDKEWGKLTNICLLFPFADYVLGTRFSPKKHLISATSKG